MRLKYLVLSMLLWLQPWSLAMALAVQVDAHVDRTAIATGESILLKVTVTDGEGEVDISGLTDFKVIPRGTSSSVQIVNTQMTRETTHAFLLFPLTKGDATIPGLPVTVKGKAYTTKPIALQVLSDPKGSQGAQSKTIWVEAELSVPNPFVGQETTYIFRFYNATNVHEAKFQPPEFNGFKAKELKDRRSSRKIIEGREFVVTELYYLLTPLQDGALTIEPSALEVGIVKPGRRRRRSTFDSIFNDPFFRPDQLDVRLLQTEAIDVHVRPLPPLDPTLTFSGLVGRYDLTAKMEKTNLRVGDSATLTISLDGQGNIMDAQAPNVKPGAEFKAYADSPEEKINTTNSGTSGSKLFRTALVPITAGQFQLPPVQLTYFDTQSESYRTLSADIPLLVVEAADQAQASPVIISPQNQPEFKKRVQFTGRDILPPKETLDALRSHRPLDLKLFALCLLVPMMAYGIIAMARRWGRSDATPAAKMKARAATALKSASHSAPEQVLTYLYQALTTAILSTAGREGEALTWQEAKAMLENDGHSTESAQSAADLLAEIESLNYSGASLSQDQKTDLLKRTRHMVKELTA